MNGTRRHPTLIWSAAAALFLLHQDWWWWDSRVVILGFLPIGLAYHVAFSLAAATLWAVACRWAWPDHIEEWAEQVEAGGTAPADAPPAATREKPR
jgi:hypothetical protein